MNKPFRKFILNRNKEIEVYAENIDKMTDEEFTEIRHNSFGASDSSRILGVNPFPGGSKEDLYHEKVNRLSNDEIGKKPTVRMGKDLEPLIIEKLEKATGHKILKPTDMYLNHISGQSVNFDGIWWNEELQVYIPREIKTVSQFGGKYYKFPKAVNLDKEPDKRIIHHFVSEIPSNVAFAGEDMIANLIQYNADLAGVPAYYYTQLQQQMDFLKTPYGTITVINVADWTLYEFTIEYAPIIAEKLKGEAMFLYMKLHSARKREAEEQNKKDGD